MEGLVVAMSLIGATMITTCSGAISDWIGRRPMLILSALLYVMSSFVMLWSPSVYVLLVGRLVDGFGIGVAVTLVPVYISETAPPQTRGMLNTLPQFTGSAGMFLSYCFIFGMSVMPSPSWRLMLGILAIPSVFYLILAFFYLPESPRWLVSKGKMHEAKLVLQRLRGIQDVSGEMAMLLEGLGIGGEFRMEDYFAASDECIESQEAENDRFRVFGDERLSWTAKPLSQTTLGQVDPIVALFGSVHDNHPSMTSASFFPTFGSMLSMTETHAYGENYCDEENYGRGSDEYLGEEFGNSLEAPLLSEVPHDGSVLESSGAAGETTAMSSTIIGGEWQLAWTVDNEKQGEVENDNDKSGHVMFHPSQTASQLSTCWWKALLEPRVKRALIVGIGIQLLQQFSGINGVLYYTPQILKEAGVGVLLSDLGVSSTSASFLISALTAFLMLPCIAVAMRLMDVCGRRTLLLNTIPVLVVSLIILIISSTITMGSFIHASTSTICVTVYFCTFVMGYGPIPNILCSEIFPTQVRGMCIALCASVFWVCDIIVTYTLPLMLRSIGLPGVFAIYATVCFISWVFVYLKVPETKGMPLEVITQFFAVIPKQLE